MKNIKHNQVCTNCVMDTTDPNISFDNNGVCDHCHDFLLSVKPNWITDNRGRDKLSEIMKCIKNSGKGNDFDCHSKSNHFPSNQC